MVTLFGICGCVMRVVTVIPYLTLFVPRWLISNDWEIMAEYCCCFTNATQILTRTRGTWGSCLCCLRPPQDKTVLFQLFYATESLNSACTTALAKLVRKKPRKLYRKPEVANIWTIFNLINCVAEQSILPIIHKWTNSVLRQQKVASFHI